MFGKNVSTVFAAAVLALASVGATGVARAGGTSDWGGISQNAAGPGLRTSPGHVPAGGGMTLDGSRGLSTTPPSASPNSMTYDAGAGLQSHAFTRVVGRDGATIYEDSEWQVKVKVDPQAILKAAKAAKDWITTTVFNRHKTVQAVYDTDNGKVVLVPVVSDAGGTRLTRNVNFKRVWGGNTDVRVWVVNTDGIRGAMAFQMKQDRKFWGDPNKGPVIHSGSKISNFSAGKHRYFAHRRGPKQWGSFIVVAEEGVSFDELDELPGITIRKE